MQKAKSKKQKQFLTKICAPQKAKMQSKDAKSKDGANFWGLRLWPGVCSLSLSLSLSNGVRDLQIHNWFQESIAGRQCCRSLPSRSLTRSTQATSGYSANAPRPFTLNLKSPLQCQSVLFHQGKRLNGGRQSRRQLLKFLSISTLVHFVWKWNRLTLTGECGQCEPDRTGLSS